MKKGEAKKQAILDAAERLFYERGYEATSVQDILDVLQCSKGSFYHHFESKVSVLETLCVRRTDKNATLCQSKMSSNCLGSESIAAVIYYALPLRSGEESFLALLLPIASREEGKTLSVQYSDALIHAFEPILEEAMRKGNEDGSIYAYYPNQMSGIILRMINDCWQRAAIIEMGVAQEPTASRTDVLSQLLNAYRFSIERLLDAPFGSMNILPLAEWVQVFRIVKERLSTQNRTPLFGEKDAAEIGTK